MGRKNHDARLLARDLGDLGGFGHIGAVQEEIHRRKTAGARRAKAKRARIARRQNR